MGFAFGRHSADCRTDSSVAGKSRGRKQASRRREARSSTIDRPQGATGVDDNGAKVSPLVHTAASGLPSHVPGGDCEDLFSAVKAGLLRLMVDERLAATPEGPVHEEASRVRAGVLSCVAALDHLHTMLHHELGQRRQLERKVSDAQAALARARAELAGTQLGERRARHLALHDGLTSLPNRRCFLERLDQALVHVKRERSALAVLYLDLDDFKLVNDAHGHVAGDELLRIVAARLARAVRAGDMMSRLGGDEFACLVADVHTRAQLDHLAHKLVDVVSAPLTINSLTLSVRPSIGIATYPTGGATAEALLQSADDAMYRAKRLQTGFAFSN